MTNITVLGIDLAKEIFQAMEACSSAHHWAHVFIEQGLKVKLVLD